MKTIIDPALLKSIGINLEASEEQAFVQHLKDTLNERVGVAISELIEEDQLEDFVAVTTSGTDQEVQDWLQANVSDYQEVAQDEYDILMGELAQNAEAVAA